MKKKNILFANVAFIIASAAILVFLLRAPEETTSSLPVNENHRRFFSMESKKEAEKYCGECHAPGMTTPLPQDHPPKYRCLFCHKRNTE
ncbi:MAG TPA: hypothetical protein VJ969_11045 [Desulfopila sp.]|nr:hypothetical protein [Desulfopila sp.]